MSQTRETRKIALAASDADGAVYNILYEGLIAIGAFKFGAKLIELAKRPDANGLINEAARKSCLDEIRDYFRTNAIGSLVLEGATARALGQADTELRLEFLLALQKLDMALYDEILLKANSELIKYLAGLADTHDEVHVAIASRRQDKNYDALGQEVNATGLFFRDVAVIKNELAALRPGKAFLFEGSFIDIVNNRNLGSHARATPSKLSQFHYNYHSDGSKLSTHIMLIHGFLKDYQSKHPDIDVSLAYHFFDDLHALHRKAKSVFSDCPTLLPANVSFQSVHYEKNVVTVHDDVIKGSGILNPNFEKFVTDFCQILGDTFQEEDTNDGCALEHLIFVAKELLQGYPGVVEPVQEVGADIKSESESESESESDDEDSLDRADRFSDYSDGDEATESESLSDSESEPTAKRPRLR